MKNKFVIIMIIAVLLGALYLISSPEVTGHHSLGIPSTKLNENSPSPLTNNFGETSAGIFNSKES